jgi:hypothetical protein
MEDFNTATMPSLKFYDLEKWEKQETIRKAAKRARDLRKGVTKDVQKEFDDEEARKAEIKKIQDERKHHGVAEALFTMDVHKVKAMKAQNLLKSKMQMAHRSGDMKEVARIQKLLEGDDGWG